MYRVAQIFAAVLVIIIGLHHYINDINEKKYIKLVSPFNSNKNLTAYLKETTKCVHLRVNQTTWKVSVV